MILTSKFYQQGTITAARNLLGCYLVHIERNGKTIGRIVETEAYPLTDPASHGFKGETLSNRVLFGPAGHAYIYLSYGTNFCLNVVTGRGRTRGAVLIRALEPIEGISVMQRRRGSRELRELASGPGKLTQALAINGTYNALPLGEGRLQVWRSDSFSSYQEVKRSEIIHTTRVGLTKAVDRPLRFYLKGNRYISRK